jgi:acid phosphatase (class A)
MMVNLKKCSQSNYLKMKRFQFQNEVQGIVLKPTMSIYKAKISYANGYTQFLAKKLMNKAIFGKPILFFMLILLQFDSNIFGQNSQQLSRQYKSLSPNENHYERFAALPITGNDATLDNLRFPLSEFRRSAYLKLRNVYLTVPVSFFKIKKYPSNSSKQTKEEITFLLDLQSKRTPEIMELNDKMADIYHDPFTNNPTDQDYERNINSLFYIGKDLGPWFQPKNLPQTTRILQNIIQDATYYFFSLKADFARPRPYHLSKEIKNPDAPGHSSYPSGHASASYVHAYLLSEIFPELKDIFMGNAYDMTFSREIRGVHYPSDGMAGKEFAKQFVKQLLKEKLFKCDFEKLKIELKSASKNGN